MKLFKSKKGQASTCETKSTRGGFTLIELLVVIVIIAVLAVTVYVALDPSKRIKDAKDSRRVTDMNSILTAVHEYIVDNKGALPTGLTTGMVEKQLGTAVTGCNTMNVNGCAVPGNADCVDLSTPLAKYLKTMPIDPGTASASLTHYTVQVDSNNIVTIKACAAEGGTNLSTSR
jgi:prepilin-type N-terminal cleavage/methylation domain-containing protein